MSGVPGGSPHGKRQPALFERYFGLIEAIFVFALAIAFYLWQRRDLRKARDAARADETKERDSEAPD